MGCVGHGGQGHVGQMIRDEILFLQRNNGCMGGMMEEWHQKLHNNSSPDDAVIYEALINYVKCDFIIDTKEGLIHDLKSYLKTLKAVHSGSDIEFAIETCLGANSVGGLSRKLQDCLHFIKGHIGDKNIGPLMEKLLESHIELRPMLLTSHGRLKDLLFLDFALDSAVLKTYGKAHVRAQLS